MKRTRFTLVILLIAVLVGCSLPKGAVSPEPSVAFTLAAQTVEAELTRLAVTLTPPTVTASSTLTPVPTTTVPPTSRPTSTQTSIPCNAAGFAGDVTIPDGTAMSPNQTFTKTWRLKNIGTCTWNSAYQLVFDHDNAMSGPASQPLTTGTVPPGGTVEVSVNLKAPVAARAYKGYWKLRDPNGVLFGLVGGGPFWVAIVVDPSLPLTLTLDFVPAKSGSVCSDGTVQDAIYVGDTANNLGSQVFVSFDISGIPTTATILEGAMDLSYGYTIVGNPFGDLGCLGVYQQDFIPLDPSDFFTGVPSGAFIVLCDQSNIDSAVGDNDFKTALQAKLGKTRIQFRLQFRDKLSNGNNSADMLRLGTPKLIVKYSVP